MKSRVRTGVVGAALASLAVLGLAAPAALARSGDISSFDGTRIHYNFFPAQGLKSGHRASTILFGPGWSSAGSTAEDGASDPTTGIVGVGPLRAAGYNVLTWDPRGFGSSGERVHVDGPDYEARDVQALISLVAKQREARLDRSGDPHLGMTGGSYGGGIQLVVAALDRRLDVIVPDIAWHSLQTSLYKDATDKAAWGAILYGLGKKGDNYDPHIDSAFRSASATGVFPPDDLRWFISRGPGNLVRRIRIPTLLTQGTVDTLFTLDEGITNYGILKGNRAPLKMLWFCGGHGSCLTKADDPKRVERAAIAWLDRYLQGRHSVDTGAGFEWIDQKGDVYHAAGYPPRSLPSVTSTGAGTLPLLQSGGSGPTTGGSGAVAAAAGPANGSKASNAVNLTVTVPGGRTFLVGAPRVTLTYSGLASRADTRIYGQIVDDATGRVLGNLVTPLPVVLDGRQHTLSRPLEAIAATPNPGQTLTLQLTSSATAYDIQRSTGTITFSRVRLALPRLDPRAVGSGSGTSSPRRCLARRSSIGPRNIGRVRLGLTRTRLLRRRLRPSRRTKRAFFFCVKRSRGRVAAVFSSRSRKAKALLVTTTARGHGNRRIHPGTRARRLRRAYPRRARIGRGLFRANRRSRRLIGVRRGRVRYVAVASPRLLRHRRVLRRYLRRAGL